MDELLMEIVPALSQVVKERYPPLSRATQVLEGVNVRSHAKISSFPRRQLTGLEAARFVGLLIKEGKFARYCADETYVAEEVLCRL